MNIRGKERLKMVLAYKWDAKIRLYSKTFLSNNFLKTIVREILIYSLWLVYKVVYYTVTPSIEDNPWLMRQSDSFYNLSLTFILICPARGRFVSVHLILWGGPQSETKHGQIHHQHCHYIQPQRDSNPVLSSTSELVADMRLSDH